MSVFVETHLAINAVSGLSTVVLGLMQHQTVPGFTESMSGQGYSQSDLTTVFYD